MSFIKAFRKSQQPEQQQQQDSRSAPRRVSNFDEIPDPNSGGSPTDFPAGGEVTLSIAQQVIEQRTRDLETANDRIEALNMKVENTKEEGIQALDALRKELQGEIGATQRAQRRAEATAKEDARRREKQIIEQGKELRRLQEALKASTDNLSSLSIAAAVKEEEATQAEKVATSEERQRSSEAQRLELLLNSLQVEHNTSVTQLESTKEALTQERDQRREAEDKAADTALQLQQRDAELETTKSDLQRAKKQLASRRSAGQEEGKDASEADGAAAEGDAAEQQAAGSQESAAAAAPSSPTAAAASPQTNAKIAKLEDALRTKEKQTVKQSTELATLRTDLQKTQRRAEDLQREADEQRTSAESMKTVAEEQKRIAADTLEQLKERNDELATLQSTHLALEASEKRTTTELNETKTSLADTKESLATAKARLAEVEGAIRVLDEKEARNVVLTNENEAKETRIAALEEEKAQLDKTVEEMRALSLQKDEVHGAVLQRKEAQLSRFEDDVTELKGAVEGMRAELTKKEEQLEEVSERLQHVTSQRDEEREAWRTRTAQTDERSANEKENQRKAEDHRAKQLTALEEKVESLLAENAKLLEAKSKLEGQVAANNVDGSEKRIRMHGISLELEELRQKYGKLEGALRRKSDDYDRMVNRMVEMEGSNTDATSNASRKVIGVLESISIEIADQLTDHLRTEYLRGGSRTAGIMVNAFSMDKVLAQEVIQMLSRMYFMVRVGAPMDDIAAAVGSKESTIRRIITAFYKSEERNASSERHDVLIKDTPASARHTYSGHERLGFLCAVNREDTPVAKLRGESWILASVCAYVPLVLRGSPFFANHSMNPKATNGRPLGTTHMICLDFNNSSFQMYQCEVTDQRALVVIVGGKFKYAVSTGSFSNVKVMMQCRTSIDAVVERVAADSPGKGGDEDDHSKVKGKWKWGKEEKFSKDEATLLQYTIKWDSRHDGLLCETQGTLLREVSLAEITLIQDLYSGKVDLGEMVMHRSWDLVPEVRPPKPPKSRREGGSGSPTGKSPAASPVNSSEQFSSPPNSGTQFS